MNKAVLMGAASIAAFSLGFAPEAGLSASGPIGANSVPKADKILYDQNSDWTGAHVESQNFTSGTRTAYDDQSADDFVVPKGRRWTIREIDVTGQYHDLQGPATSENVIFYKNGKNKPRKSAGTWTFANLHGTDNEGSFVINLPGKGITLNSGTYWISVVANMNYPTAGIWGWDTTGDLHEHQAMWRNPDNGYSLCRK